MTAGLFLRPTLAAIAGLVIIVGLTGLATLNRFDAAWVDLLRSRFAVVLNDLSSFLEAEMALGLPLQSIPRVRSRLDEQAQLDPEILGIEVFDADGLVLFSSDSSYAGDLVAERWLEAWTTSPDGRWFVAEAHGDTIGATIHNSFDQAEGIVAITYSRAAYEDARADLIDRVLMIGGVIILAGTVAAGLVFRRITRSAAQRLQTMAEVTRQLRDNPAIVLPPVDDPLFDPYAATIRDAITSVDAARRRIHDIDNEA